MREDLLELDVKKISKEADLAVEVVQLEMVIPYARNPRKNEAAVSKVMASLKEFGWRQPIVVDPEMVIVAGHTRYEAAKRLGWTTAPVHVADGLTPAQIKAYRLADNRSHDDSKWDDELLGLELEDLKELDFDLSLTGFELEELGDYLGQEAAPEEQGETPIPEPLPVPVVQPGDVWLCGPHRVVCGDVRDKASLDKALNGRKAGMCVTSPPYWGLRDYGTASWEGGEGGCDHVERKQPQNLAALADRMAPRKNPRNPTRLDDDQVNARSYRHTCAKCGARRVDAQIGLEKTPEEFVATMVEVFRGVREALADDGTLWVNMGDSYAGGGPHHGDRNLGKSGTNRGSSGGVDRAPPGLKPKDLCGMPWRLAFALRADGWYLRQDIIWAKPNPMPESVTDRFTKAHEYLFLLSKREKYFFDAEAVKEPAINAGKFVKTNGDDGMGDFGRTREGFRRGITVGESRNRRSVWTVATQPTPEAHFATFPEALISPAILAGTSEKGRCQKCGGRWERIVDREFVAEKRVNPAKGSGQKGLDASNGWENTPRGNVNVTTTGWGPTCACALDPIPDLILEPFLGAGTTMIVAEKTGRHCAGVELNPVYADIAIRRWQNFTGQKATREADRTRYDEAVKIAAESGARTPPPELPNASSQV